MIILSISHNIYLTRDERYSLADGEDVNVVASSVPVWFYEGSTSEPATEVFCEYTLMNERGQDFVASTKTGYTINIPQAWEDWEPPERIPDDEWRKMSQKLQERWYEKNPHPKTGESLRDLCDGGGGYLRFQWEQDGKRHGHAVRWMHYIEISDISVLQKTLVI